MAEPVQRMRDGLVRLIIFDFDGVVADSETTANRVLAQCLTRIGIPTTLEQSIALYMGRRWADSIQIMEARFGGPLPETFIADLVVEAHASITQEAMPVPGVEAFLERFADVPRCIASSSGLPYIGACLEQIGLASWFEHRFSGQDVEHGKPAPDLFLKAAAILGADPADCLVIEDSAMGVLAGKAAGMRTIGLLAGSHILEGHAERLIEAGADHICASYEQVARLLEA